MFSLPCRLILSSAVFTLLIFAGCGQQSREGPAPVARSAPPGALPSTAPRVAGTLEERRAEFLNRIRAADPDKATIERAMINDQNEVGLILSRKTNLDDVPKLLKSIILQMDQSFPGQTHLATAYAPTSPPRAIGTARSDARTRDISYQPASNP